jgi:predicted O-methyltransferase YrrM
MEFAPAGRLDYEARLNEFSLSRDVYLKFANLHYHPGYSRVEDVHFVDSEFPWSVTCTPSEAELLHDLVKVLRCRSPLEIGSYIGWSTAHIASSLQHNTKLQCVEPFYECDNPPEFKHNQRALLRFRENLMTVGCWSSVELITGPSPECLSGCAPAAGWDFVFLDGWHNNGQPLRDIDGLLPHLNSTVALAIHDPWVPDVRDGVMRLMSFGFEVCSLNTANFLTVAWRGIAPADWAAFCRIASQPRHVLREAQIMRNYIGLCERSVLEGCVAFGIPYHYTLL